MTYQKMGISGGGHGNSLQYSCLKNLMDRGAWRAIVHGVAKESDTTQWLNNSSNFTTILKEQQQDGQFQQKSHHQWIQWRRQQLYLSFEPRSLEESNQFHLLDLTWNKNMVKNKRKCPCFHYKKKKMGISTDSGKALDKIQHLLIIKTLRKPYFPAILKV